MFDITDPNLLRSFKGTFLHKTLKKCKIAFWSVFGFSSGVNLLLLFLPIYTSQVLDRVLSSGSVATLLMLSLITLGSFFCSAILEIARSAITIKLGDFIDNELSSDLIRRAIALTPIKGNTSSGETIRDLQIIKNFIISNGIFSFFDAPWSILYLILIFMIHPSTGIIALIGIALLLSLALVNDLATRKLIRESNEENVKNINEIEVATRNSEVVEAMGMSEDILDAWSLKNDKNKKLQTRISVRSAVIMGITKIFRALLQIAVIGVGAYLALSGGQTAGGIIAASILMGRVLAPFEMAISNWKAFSQAKVAYIRLQMMIIASPKRSQSMQLPDPIGEIIFDRVFFTPYGSQKPTIKGVSFKVAPGTIVGVIGSSASGKSTIAKLMVGVLKPISGVVRMDGADVYTWERRHFGRHVGYLPQDVELFNATVKDNIARFDKNFSSEAVIKAAKVTGVHEMILELPDGYDTMLGHGGIMLSGGQKQRIGLARAFYNDIKLLVLDEPNSSLDTLGELQLINALKYAKEKSVTTFVMTHKLNILSVVDTIMVIKDGMLATMGSRDEVLKQISQQAAQKNTQESEVKNAKESTSDDKQTSGDNREDNKQNPIENMENSKQKASADNREDDKSTSTDVIEDNKKND